MSFGLERVSRKLNSFAEIRSNELTAFAENTVNFTNAPYHDDLEDS